MQRNETNLREALHLATSSDYQTRLYAVEVLTDGIEELLLLRPTLAALTAERERMRAAVRRYFDNGSPITEAQAQAEREALTEIDTWLTAITPLADAPARPTIVCLCGSTRFWRTFQEASLRETLAGRIVLSIGAASGTDDEHFGNLPRAEYDRVKEQLDQLHLRKVEMADEVLVLNVDGYIGESTRRELAHARQLGKHIRWWEPTDDR